MNLEKALAEAPLKHPEAHLYTHGAIKPGPDPPRQIVAANRWPIPFAVPSATLIVSPFGSSPSASLPVKYCCLISDNASK